MLEDYASSLTASKFGTDHRRITICGSTGSIGQNTLRVIKDCHRWCEFEMVALVAATNVQELIRQVHDFRPEFAVIANEHLYQELKDGIAGTKTKAMAGRDAAIQVAEVPTDWYMAATVGFAGLASTLAAVRQGCTVALANKECLVCGGQFFMDEVRRCGATLVPVDSEHSATARILEKREDKPLRRIILTASGGAFRNWSPEAIRKASPKEALQHPTWFMGNKITIDSATLMNKALELVEAVNLFSVSHSSVEIVVHPQSIIHAMVEYFDGSIYSHMSIPDMRVPILHALVGDIPEEFGFPFLDFTTQSRLEFEPVRNDVFPAIDLARRALSLGGTSPCIMNAANEVAVGFFLDGEVDFFSITDTVISVVEEIKTQTVDSFSDLEKADCEAREIAKSVIFSRKTAA
jgi:1-deoxy-D-xylulose-5-phosphate reductoisomerase